MSQPEQAHQLRVITSMTEYQAKATCARNDGKRQKMKKTSQQSRSGWGGKRAGAGAPAGNTNAVKHGERSRRAFFPLVTDNDLPPIASLRARNLLLAECVGDMKREGRYYSGRPEDWREQMLIDGIMWQHTRRMMRVEVSEARQAVIAATLALRATKQALRQQRAETRRQLALIDAAKPVR